MSWLPVAALGFSVLSFGAGWYLSERRRKLQKKDEIIEDIFPKLIIDLTKGLSTYRIGYKRGYSRFESIFPYLREISDNRRIYYLKSIDNELYQKLINFQKETFYKIEELEEIRKHIKDEVIVIWGDIQIVQNHNKYNLSQIMVTPQLSLLERIFSGLYWEFWRQNAGEIRKIVFETSHTILEFRDNDEIIRINIEPEHLILRLSETFDKLHQKFLEPFNELEIQIKTEIEDFFIPRLESHFKI